LQNAPKRLWSWLSACFAALLQREIGDMRGLCLGTAILASVGLASPALAIINEPVPTNAYISFGGLDWAWASAASPTGCCDGFVGPIDLSYQSTQGWRLPTAADWANAPTAEDFLFAGAIVPDGGQDPVSLANFGGDVLGNDGACAAPWFSTANFCNFGDGQIGAVWGIPNSPYEGQDSVDTWLVRGEFNPGVPEPASWAMLIAGFGLTGAVMRRRRVVVA
jgi:hypothetical protein